MKEKTKRENHQKLTAPLSGVQKALPDVLLCFGLSRCWRMVTSSQWTVRSLWQLCKQIMLRHRWPRQQHRTATSSWDPGRRRDERMDGPLTEAEDPRCGPNKDTLTHELAFFPWLLLPEVLPSIFLYMACSTSLWSEYFFTSLDSSAWIICAGRKQPFLSRHEPTWVIDSTSFLRRQFCKSSWNNWFLRTTITGLETTVLSKSGSNVWLFRQKGWKFTECWSQAVGAGNLWWLLTMLASLKSANHLTVYQERWGQRDCGLAKSQ